MLDDITQTGEQFDRDLASANSTRALDEVRVRYFGRKSGLIPALFDRLKQVPKEQKKEAGAALNKLRDRTESALKEKSERVATDASARKEARDIIDITLPGRAPKLGHLHPITIVRRELEAIFLEMGYSLDPGPEVESDWYNFEALNFTPDHPARDMQDTFFLDVDQLLLRTHTSNVQIRSMQQIEPPLRVLSCGRVYRRDEITMRKSPVFHQAEGFLVDRGIHIGHLRATLEQFIKRLFGADLAMRMRPSYFPFTEPSAEVDMSCVFCRGKGCGTCSYTGWMEILGSGMVHPAVLAASGIDADRFTGYAFGAGIDRLAMLRYGVSDVRQF